MGFLERFAVDLHIPLSKGSQGGFDTAVKLLEKSTFELIGYPEQALGITIESVGQAPGKFTIRSAIKAPAKFNIELAGSI